MSTFKLMAPLPEVRPNWLRWLICILYFPLVLTILLICTIFIDFITSFLNSTVKIWKKFIVPCWTGIDHYKE